MKNLSSFYFGRYFVFIGLFWFLVWLLIQVTGRLLAGAIRRPGTKGGDLRKSRFDPLTVVAFSNHALLIIIAVSFFGLAVGIMAGNSRTSVADTLMTSVLTVYGGLTVYWFAKAKEVDRVLSALTLIIFTALTLYGTQIGGENRIRSERADRSYQEQLMQRQADLAIYEHEGKKRIDLWAEDVQKKKNESQTGR